MGTLTGVKTYDLRFPTPSTLSGSDAMNKDPRLSSAYVVITTDADDGLSGSGFVFTVGRGNDVVMAAIDSLSRVLVSRNVENLPDDMRAAWDMSTTFSCAGSAQRRASSTWPSASCSARHRPDRGRRRRADAEPHHVQAVSAGGQLQGHADRRHARRRAAGDRARIPARQQVRRARVPPHAGGVGLCKAVRHFAMFDYLAVSGQWDDRVIEYVDNQHEYFVHPTEIVNGRYKAPTAPGSGVDVKLEAAERYLYKG